MPNTTSHYYRRDSRIRAFAGRLNEFCPKGQSRPSTLLTTGVHCAYNVGTTENETTLNPPPARRAR